MREVFIRLLENALEDFYAQEQRNLQLNVHEICHGHRLAIYFENRIREYDDTHRERLFDNYFVDIYHFRFDFQLSDVTLNTRESIDCRCVSLDELVAMNNEDEFLHFERIMKALQQKK